MADANLKYCPKCGAKVVQQTNFCSNCGYSLAQSNGQESHENSETENDQEKQSTNPDNYQSDNSQIDDRFNESSRPGLITSTKLLYQDAFTLNKRMGRADYWWGLLGINLINLAIEIVFIILLKTVSTMHIWWELLLSLVIALSVITAFSASIRRLHDVDVSPGLILLEFVPVIGSLIVLFFLVSKSNNHDNHYPKSSTRNWTSWAPSWVIIVVTTALLLLPINIFTQFATAEINGSFYNTYIYDDNDAVQYVTKKLEDKDIINDNSKIKWSEKYQAIVIPSKTSTLSQLEVGDYDDWEPIVTEVTQVSKKLAKAGHEKYSRIYIQNSHNKSLYLLRVYKGHTEYDVENDD